MSDEQGIDPVTGLPVEIPTLTDLVPKSDIIINAPSVTITGSVSIDICVVLIFICYIVRVIYSPTKSNTLRFVNALLIT